jgi:hypothetical protein
MRNIYYRYKTRQDLDTQHLNLNNMTKKEFSTYWPRIKGQNGGNGMQRVKNILHQQTEGFTFTPQVKKQP